jgi:D-alanyl-D-alanine carboxypeptidase/D-alanyl-D-alanine-endopeptidase (penicillin-binding protein 4)
VLSGDLHLKGGGDPKLTYDQFGRLLRQIRARGIREIRGDLVLDRSAFAANGADPGASTPSRCVPTTSRRMPCW